MTYLAILYYVHFMLLNIFKRTTCTYILSAKCHAICYYLELYVILHAYT